MLLLTRFLNDKGFILLYSAAPRQKWQNITLKEAKEETIVVLKFI